MAGRDETSLGEFDYVIVGAGSAGCVLANRLSADPDAHVCLLEAGGKDSYFWIHIPIGYLYTQNNPASTNAPRSIHKIRHEPAREPADAVRVSIPQSDGSPAKSRAMPQFGFRPAEGRK